MSIHRSKVEVAIVEANHKHINCNYKHRIHSQKLYLKMLLSAFTLRKIYGHAKRWLRIIYNINATKLKK